MENIEWGSDEIKNYYKLINIVYTKTILSRHPYVKKIEICPKSFNNIFKSEKWTFNLDVRACADFILKNEMEREGILNDFSLGADINQILRTTFKMVPGYELIGDKHISPELELNTEGYCHGVIKYVFG
jgi:hypothetical protein